MQWKPQFISIRRGRLLLSAEAVSEATVGVSEEEEDTSHPNSEPS